jgi:predicted RNA-binding Zn ribbon-like protein
MGTDRPRAAIFIQSADVNVLTECRPIISKRPPGRNRFTAYDAVMSDLMPPDPPFASGAPYWYWLGGRPALDFVNSRRERWRRGVDCLVSDDDVVAWLAAAGLLATSGSAPRGLLEESRELREAIDGCVRAVVAGEPAPREDVRVIDAWLLLAGSRPALSLGADGQPRLAERRASDSPRRALGLIALDAARMLGDERERRRVRICAADTCSARFYDRSPAGRRRWCSMALCGNAAKARRHRQRLTTDPEAMA